MIKIIITHVFKYLPIYLVTLFIGLIHFLPHSFLYKYKDTNRVYYPFSFAETLYASQVKEVLEGHISVGDPQFWEHKYTFPSVFPIVPIWTIALLSYLSGSVYRGFIISDFIFPAVLFLCFYKLGVIFTNKKFESIAASLCVLIFYPFFSKFPPLSIDSAVIFFRELALISISRRLPFYRTPNPQISLIFLVVAIVLLYRLWQLPSWKKVFFTAAISVVLYFVYFYHVTFFVTLTGLSCVYAIVTRNKNWIYLLTVIFISIFFGIIYLQISGLEAYRSLFVTGGRFYATYIDWLYTLRYTLFAVIIYFLLKKNNRTLMPFFVLVPLSGIVVMNFQIFTGWTMQPGHWPQTTIEPIMINLVSLVLLIRMKNHLSRFRIYFIITIILFYALFTQVLYPHQYKNVWTVPDDLIEVYSWIEKSIPPQSVIAALDIEANAYIPILTSANIFLPVEEYHYATVDEIWERIIYAYKLYSVPPEGFDPKKLAIPTFFELTYNVNKYKHEEFDQYEPEMNNQIVRCYPSLCSVLYAVPKSKVVEIKDKYAKTKISENPYRIDYAIFSPNDEKLGAKMPSGNIVFTAGVYKVIKIN